ncbi:thiamine pyrophosphate-binding protein [Spirillospora sp. NPDC052269]
MTTTDSRGASATPTVADHVVQRLADLGIGHAFGVPGDYAFAFDDAIEANADVAWIGCANELNAAYAADGYARIRGAAILSTTYAVGELSALNGVMGSKAERVPVFHLVGMPSTKLQRARAITHHTFGDGTFDRFAHLSSHAVCASTILTPQNAIAEMERVIAEALTERRPAYVCVPQDLARLPVIGTPVAGVRVADVAQPSSDPGQLEAAVAAILERFTAAGSHVVLPAYTVARYGLQGPVVKMLDAIGLPYATTTMDKAVLSESTPGFLGMNSGTSPSPGVKEAVEGAEFVLDLGGIVLSDFNTSAWTAGLDPSKVVSVLTDHVRIGDEIYAPVSLADAIARLTVELPPQVRAVGTPSTPPPPTGSDADRVSSAGLYPRLQQFLRTGDIVVVETGLGVGGVAGLRFPDGAVCQNQMLWGSIGWATPAAFGACLAAPDRRTILVTGDGSHQLTANDIGAMGHHGAKPIVLVLNNSMFGVEEVLSPRQGHEYDMLVPWNYHRLPDAFGCTGWHTARVTTLGELDAALKTAAAHDDASYIEVVLGRADIPPSVPAQVIERLYRDAPGGG